MIKNEENYLVAKESIKEIVMIMNGLSEQGFLNRMMNDPFFRKGFDALVDLYMQVKF